MNLKGLCLCVIALMALAADASAQGIREMIVKMKHADTVWALDQYETVIMPKRTMTGDPTDEFCNELLGILKSYGDLEMLVPVKDELLNSVSQKWLKVDFQNRIAGHPVSGHNVTFLATDQFYYRVSNVAEIQKYFVITRKGFYGKNEHFIRQIVIKHFTAQPMVWRSEIVNKIGTDIPAEGEMDKGLFSRGLNKGVEVGDLVQYFVNIGQKWGGKSVFIINTRKGLIEAEPLDVYEYMVSTPPSMMKAIFYCDNPGNPFVIKNEGKELKVFYRDLAGMQYVALSEPACEQGSSFDRDTGICVKEPVARKPESKIEPEFAKLIAGAIQSKSDFEITKSPMMKRKAVYHGSLGEPDCEYVTIFDLFFQGNNRFKQTSQKDFKVCAGNQIEQIETNFVSKIPVEVESLVKAMARKAQQNGSSQGIYNDFLVIGNAKRDARKCAVEIKIFKKSYFVESRIVDGCRS